jgi:hypothetical protein
MLRARDDLCLLRRRPLCYRQPVNTRFEARGSGNDLSIWALFTLENSPLNMRDVHTRVVLYG